MSKSRINTLYVWGKDKDISEYVAYGENGEIVEKGSVGNSAVGVLWKEYHNNNFDVHVGKTPRGKDRPVMHNIENII